MLDDDQLEDAIRDIILDICEVMYKRGYSEVSIGAIMRLIGVGNDHASKHDGHLFALDDQFLTVIETRKSLVPERAPTDVTLH